MIYAVNFVLTLFVGIIWVKNDFLNIFIKSVYLIAAFCNFWLLFVHLNNTSDTFRFYFGGML